jgi:phosphate starvation-inducible protein PhoH and related proteins
MKKKQKLTETNNENNNLFPKKDNSPVIPQRSKFRGNLNIYDRPLTPKQLEFLELAKDKDTKIMFVSGPAGTSKTYLSVLHALRMINEKRVSDLIYIRSAVESADSKLGFLPGEADEKMAPYLQPLMDKLIELLPRGDIDALQKDGRFTSIPVGFLRGLNWNAKVIVADEAQNLTYKELFTLITRTGEFSKVFILGDPEQSDINGKSGFVKMVNMFRDEESRQNGIHVFEFTDEDIVRSGLVKFIIQRARAELNPKK